MGERRPLQLYKVMGYDRQSKRNWYGHHFVNGKCLDCGLTQQQLEKRFKRR